MSFILRRSLIFFALLVMGLVGYSVWYGMKADRYDETAVPYLESTIPELTSWQYYRLRPLLSPTARQVFENKKVRLAYQAYSQLGQLQSMDKPQYIASSFKSDAELGDIEVIDYQVVLQFDSGPAVIKIKLIADGKSYFVHRFSIQSDVFADGSSATVN
ncbi:MAG: hypothetical protein ACI9LO_001217 [Planctomycetota bacterium]|jgi:hypothetical protein